MIKMNVPTSIKNKITASAMHFSKARILNSEIREWLKKQNAYNDLVIDQLIDGTEIGYNPSAIIEFLENHIPEGNGDIYK